MKAQKSPVVKAIVTTKQAQARAQHPVERDLIRRHQAALRAIDRLDAQRRRHPHVPALAAQIERNDAIDWEAPVIKTIIERAGGPRTASHPMATRIDVPIPEPRPMATRLRPSLIDPQDSASEAPDRLAELLGTAASALLITGSILAAMYLGTR